MPTELQQLITGIEALIKVQSDTNRLQETNLELSAATKEENRVQTEALAQLLIDLKAITETGNGAVIEVLKTHADALADIADLKISIDALLSHETSKDESKETDKITGALNTINETLLNILEESKKEIVTEAEPEDKRPQKVEIVNFPKEKEGPEEVILKEPVEIAKPAWYQQFSYSKITEAFKTMLGSLVFRVKHEEIVKVYVVDEKGKIISDFSPIVRTTSNGGGGGFPEVGLKSIDGKPLNPATAEGQAAIVAAIEAQGGGSGASNVGIKDAADTRINPATSEKQDEQIASTEMIESELEEINTRLQALFGAMGVTDQNQRFRVVIDAGTITTVSTVSTVTTVTTVSTVANQTNMGGNPVAQVPMNITDMAIGAAIRSQIITS